MTHVKLLVLCVAALGLVAAAPSVSRALASRSGGVTCPAMGACPYTATLAAQDEAPAIRWRAATDTEKKAATAAVEGQLKAFKADDYAAAEKFQHSALRQGVRSPAEFRKMMKSAYPQVVNYKKVTFGAISASAVTKGVPVGDGEHVEVPATLLGEDGITVRMVYTLVKEQGEYRVAGVEGGQPTRVPIREVA